jgi:hypothetical protein
MRSFAIRSAISVVVCLVALVFPAAAHADESQGPSVVNPVSNGEVCGLKQIDYTSTNGPAKLALEVSKGVATEVSTSVSVDVQVVSAGVGFSVTESVTVTDKIEIEVAEGQFGEIYAFPMFETISFEIVGGERGTGHVLRPVGVCFSPIRS